MDNYASIAATSELIRQKKLSPPEIISACLKRIEQLNPALNAFITVLSDQAMEEAEIADKEIKAGKWKGPLHGIPVGIKDMYDTAGIKTTAAFAGFKDRIPKKDAVSVKKLKEAGAIAIGKMNMHELAMGTTSVKSFFGPVHNPWNTNYVAGGSSGGSAAAIAAGLCYATLDTDAVGSCRLPAACCGVTGFKATYGLLNAKGILEGEKADENILRLAHPAFMCRSAEDAAILLNILADRENKGAHQDYTTTINAVRQPVIGIAKYFKASKEIMSAFSEAVEIFYSFGYTIKENIEIPMDAVSFDTRNVEKDRKKISQLLFSDIDVLLLPTLANDIPTIKEAMSKGPQAVSPDNTFFCNYYGLPAISIPCGFSKDGLPEGIQIVGPHWKEDVVLNMAWSYQQATEWQLKHPAVESLHQPVLH